MEPGNININIFVDMDGTLTMYSDEDGNYDPVEKMMERGYFISRPCHRNVCASLENLKNTMKTCNINANIYTLSTVFNDEHSTEEKKIWLDSHVNIPEECRLFVPFGTTKTEYVTSMFGSIGKLDILLDDYNHNLKKWPGIPIKCHSESTHINGSWDGYSISASMRPDMICKTLTGIVLAENAPKPFNNNDEWEF